MLDNRYIIYAIIAVGIFTAYMAIVNLFRADRMRARAKNAGGWENQMDEEEKISPLAVVCEQLLRITGVQVKAQKHLSMELAQAGIDNPNAITYYLFFKRFIQPFFFIAGAYFFIQVLLFSSGMATTAKLMRLIFGLVLLIIGLYGANLYVSNRKQRRQEILLRSFPEILDLLLVCIESGLGLDAALARACKELHHTHPVIAAELERTRMELTMLSDRSQALQNLADRTQIVPFKSLVSALIQTEKFGTSLVDTLRVLSEDQRSTRLLNAENRAARIPVLITIPLILCILPAFVMIILGPPIVKVVQQGGIFGSRTK